MKESHGIVVTDLAFLPDSLDGRNLRGDNETAMLSVAVDSRCQVHAVPNPSKTTTTTITTTMSELSLSTFYLLSRLVSCLAAARPLWPPGGGRPPPPTAALPRLYLKPGRLRTGRGCGQTWTCLQACKSDSSQGATSATAQMDSDRLYPGFSRSPRWHQSIRSFFILWKSNGGYDSLFRRRVLNLQPCWC